MKDKYDKLKLYEMFGIKEYFLVLPEYRSVDLFRLKNGKYEYIQSYFSKMMFEIEVVNEEFDVDDVFEDI